MGSFLSTSSVPMDWAQCRFWTRTEGHYLMSFWPLPEVKSREPSEAWWEHTPLLPVVRNYLFLDTFQKDRDFQNEMLNHVPWSGCYVQWQIRAFHSRMNKKQTSKAKTSIQIIVKLWNSMHIIPLIPNVSALANPSALQPCSWGVKVTKESTFAP